MFVSGNARTWLKQKPQKSNNLCGLKIPLIVLALGTLSLAGAANPEIIPTSSVPSDRNQPVIPPVWLGSRPPMEGEWTQTFNENFESNTLDDKLWTPSNREKTYGKVYLYTPDCVSVADGNLLLTVKKQTVEGWEYVSGQIDGFGKWTQTYGYFEARMKWPDTMGLFPAFWLMPDRDIHGPTDQQSIWNRNSTKWRGMEFDIMEHIAAWGPGRYNVATHWDGYGDLHKFAGNEHLYYGPTPDGWHVFGMLWEPGKVTWYCDGIKKAEWTNDRVGSIPVHFILSAQIGGWGLAEDQKKPSPENLPASVEVDYVRAWQRRDLAEAASRIDTSIPARK